MIQIKNLCKTYSIDLKNVKALQNINTVLPEKGMVFIVGKSGSGKSTLLNIISGFDKPSSGEVIIAGDMDITKFNNEEMDNYHSSCLGFVFQDFNLIEDLSVYENIRLALSIKGEKNPDLIKKILKQVGLKGYEDRKISELKDGKVVSDKERISTYKNEFKIAAGSYLFLPLANENQKTKSKMLLK